MSRVGMRGSVGGIVPRTGKPGRVGTFNDIESAKHAQAKALRRVTGWLPLGYNFSMPARNASRWKTNESTRSPPSSRTSGPALPICGGIFDFDVKSVRLAEVERELEDPKIWDDPKRAQDLGKEKKALERVVHELTGVDAALKDSGELFSLARTEGDDATLGGVATDGDPIAQRV